MVHLTEDQADLVVLGLQDLMHYLLLEKYRSGAVAGRVLAREIEVLRTIRDSIKNQLKEERKQFHNEAQGSR
jgi:hypothetical protein